MLFVATMLTTNGAYINMYLVGRTHVCHCSITAQQTLKREIEMAFQNVRHGHGTSVGAHFVQLAINRREMGGTVWPNEVTHEE